MSLIATIPATAVAVLGFWIVHALSKARQRRDETFKLVQTTHDLIDKAADQAAKTWKMTAAAKTRQKEVELVLAAVARAGKYLEMLRARDEKSFVLSTEMVAFRRAATSDIEVAKPADEDRRAQIATAAADLQLALDKAFLKKYG